MTPDDEDAVRRIVREELDARERATAPPTNPKTAEPRYEIVSGNDLRVGDCVLRPDGMYWNVAKVEHGVPCLSRCEGSMDTVLYIRQSSIVSDYKYTRVLDGRAKQPGDRVGPDDVRVGDVVREHGVDWSLDTRLTERVGSEWRGTIVAEHNYGREDIGTVNRVARWIDMRVALVSRADSPVEPKPRPEWDREALAYIVSDPAVLASNDSLTETELFRRLAPHVEAEARAMLAEIGEASDG